MQPQQTRPPRRFLEEAPTNIAAWGLILIGIIGTSIGVLDVFVELEAVVPGLKPTLEIILIVVSFLALALGIERLTALKKLEAQIRNVHSDVASVLSALSSVVPFQPLFSERAIMAEALHTISRCQDTDVIRATGLSSGSLLPDGQGSQEEKIYGEYTATIASRIRQARDRGGSLAYRNVLRPLSESRTVAEERRQAFTDAGVPDRLFIRYLDMAWPLEILLVGDTVIMGFLSFTGDLTFRMGIRITNKELVGYLTQWYDDFLWSAATTTIA